MSKWLLRLVSLVVVIGLLGGCASDDGSDKAATSNENQTESNENNEGASEEKQEEVVITISKDNGAEVITEKEVPIDEGAILMDVMEENFVVETDFDGAFITSIEGVSPKDGEQKSWMFFVNDEMPNVGAKELELSPGDKITFDLQAWE